MDFGVLFVLTLLALVGLGLAFVVKKKGLPKEIRDQLKPENHTAQHAHDHS